MIQISKKELTEMVNSGAKKEEISSKYSLKNAATGRLLKEAGLTIKKTHKPTFTLVDDSSTIVVPEVTPEVTAINI